MCSFSVIIRVVTLDNLYSMKNTKGRINWLIFVIFKVMAPALLVMVTESDEIKTYGNSMMEYYKESLKTNCADIKYVDTQFELSPDPSLTELLKDLESKENKTIKTYTRLEMGRFFEKDRDDKQPSREDKLLGATLQSYLMFLRSANITSPMEESGRYHDDKFCCENYRKMAREAVLCMRKQQLGNKSDTIHFGIIMFCPCFGAMLVALILVPFKHISSIRTKCFTSDGSNLQSTPEEKLGYFKDCLHFIADLLAFYVVLHKIQAIGVVMIGPCVQNKLCLAKYTSMQMLYLIAMAQTPWISILWNFVY